MEQVIEQGRFLGLKY